MSKSKDWFEATRPKTLAAAWVPVATGTVLAWYYAEVWWPSVIIALFCAFCIQIGTNLANDYFDFKKGADTEERVGFKRATASGAISEQQIFAATILSFGLAFFAGIYLVWYGGWVVLLIGVLSILFGILYTGGPFPLAYNGLGDIFVLIFFGLVAVHGTYYVSTLDWNMDVMAASLAIGALAVNILVINNLRDVHTDKKANKNTLGVIFGENFLRYEYIAMLLLAYSAPLWYVFGLGFDYTVLLPLLTIPLSIPLIKSVFFEEDKASLNITLEKTAKFMVIYGLLFVIGFILAA